MLNVQKCFRFRYLHIENFIKWNPMICQKYENYFTLCKKQLFCSIPQIRERTDIPVLFYSTAFPSNSEEHLVDSNLFEKVCEETLESLTEFFEELVESNEKLASGDISYSSGVLTINLGKTYGTYVINRQSPNRQIWLSSPFSGPKRYDYVVNGSCWIYKHDSVSLHQLLQNEFSIILGKPVNFSKCLHSKV